MMHWPKNFEISFAPSKKIFLGMMAYIKNAYLYLTEFWKRHG